MALEIERKFKVLNDAYKHEAESQMEIVQGYVALTRKATVRVRIYGERGYLTLKSKSQNRGLTRHEWEYEIPREEAEAMLSLIESGRIEKIRYRVPVGRHIFEVDEFMGENQGLTIAEVELQEEDEHFERPTWLGEELTGDSRYYNSYLSHCPFSRW